LGDIVVQRSRSDGTGLRVALAQEASRGANCAVLARRLRWALMTTSESRALSAERYINLETFKKDGTGVKTPVWCVPLDGKIVVYTNGASYKVKRVGRNPKVRVAPCDMRGNVRGAWVDGECHIISGDPARIDRAHRAFIDKYGWQVRLLDVFAAIARRTDGRAYLEITV
jgi:PPOX class probable F420-dependent enzyme